MAINLENIKKIKGCKGPWPNLGVRPKKVTIVGLHFTERDLLMCSSYDGHTGRYETSRGSDQPVNMDLIVRGLCATCRNNWCKRFENGSILEK